MQKMDKNNVLNITKEKFREKEIVVSICESYQIIGNEYKNRLLAIVNSNGSYALFSFAASKWPPEVFSDLNVDSIFPVNEVFRIEVNITGSVSQHNFKIFSSNGQSMFYYYPLTSPLYKEFPDFQIDIRLAESLRVTPANFQWLESYQREDLLAIDRSIADGSVTLKKRESKFREELEKHEHEYIVYKKYGIYTATYNVNGQPSSDICLKDWLSASEEPPDIYAVAFQELDLSPKAITFSESRPDPVWVKKVMDGLHSGAVYEELVSVRLVGMMLIIVVKQELRKNVIRYATQAVGTGALNFMGNKGGVGVSLQLNEAHICFVNSHLAAHISEVDRRKEDHDEIIRRMQFEYGIVRRSIDEHNHVFWIGDLNYRLTENPAKSLFADENNIGEVLRFDQLYQEMQRKRVFHNYIEGPITFRPTYKYDPGTDNWDSSEKNRAPAWCDRVLWKGDRISQLSYNNVMSLQLSDHKPVYAVFSAGVKTKDEVRYKRVHEDVLKRVDKYENDNQPQITVEETDIDFDIIQFNETYTRDFTVANNCHLPVHFEFRGKDGKGSKICENWLKVEPTQGELITGDSLSIRIKLLIDTSAAWRMHRKQRESVAKVPLDILVLHVDNGRDIFITIFGEYKPSCFGFSVETLIRLPRPVHELELPELMAIENSTEHAAAVPSKIEIPREIYLIVDYLHKNALTTPNLFTLDRKYQNNPNVNEIRDWLDIWAAHPFSGTPHTAAETLLMLLESSPEPLVSPLEEECLHAENFDKCREIIRILSSPKKNVFIYICLFLQDVLKHSAQNKLDIVKLSTIFARVMLRGHGAKSYYRALTERERDDRRTVFMHRFLDSDIREFARSELSSVLSENLI